MEKKFAPMTTKALRLPGEDHGQQLAIIRKVLDSLAPGVARNHPEFVQLVRFYLLDQQSPQPAPDLRPTLAKAMRKLQAQGYELDVESLMLAIDGMDVIMKELKLESLEELNQYAQASKEAFRFFARQPPVEGKTEVLSKPVRGCKPGTSPEFRFGREE